MNLQQWIINLSAKLLRQFPEENGAFSVVINAPSHVSFHEGFEGDPLADDRPQFIKDDEVGWERIGTFRNK